VKILRVITRLNIGGPSHQAQHLHLRLGQMGHDCTLVHGPVGPDEGDHRFLGDEGVITFPELTRPIRPFLDFACLRKLTALLESEPFDILHTHTAKAGLLARAAALIAKKHRRKKGFPELRVFHTYHGHVFRGYFNPLISRFFLGLERWLAGHSDHLITLSPALAREIAYYLKVPEDRLDIIALGLDLEPFLDPGLEPFDLNARFGTNFKFWVGWVGRMVSIKNPLEFLALAEDLGRRNAEVGFAMVGDGPLRKEVEKHLHARGLGGKVHLTGWQEDMPRWMKSFCALVNTSHNEGTPVALLEAMAAGTPVLASDVGGCRDILPDHEPARVYAPGAILGQTDQVLSWIEEGARISIAGRQAIVERHSIGVLADKLEALYRGRPNR